MKIHEYQAKQLFQQYNIPIPQGKVASTPNEARTIAEEQRGSVWVVKAQIHAGGRGKAGGVKIVKSLDEVEKTASEILGKKLVTHQTGSEGKEVLKVLIEQGADIAKEYYLAITLDRKKIRNTIIASSEGGTEIEELSTKNPEKIIRQSIDPDNLLKKEQIKYLADSIGFSDPDLFLQFSNILIILIKLYIEKDCSLLEINPLVLTGNNKLIALDAKINFDDNALFRHPEILELRDITEEDPLEVEASKYNLNYIKLDGNIGCMVNGAGLAMATMDLIKLVGGEPANFLDVGGGTNVERVTNAFKILTSDKNVKSILINIFGGIVRCDVVAEGIIEALKTIEVKVPITVRLEGTNFQEARELLLASGQSFNIEEGFENAAKKAVEMVKS